MTTLILAPEAAAAGHGLIHRTILTSTMDEARALLMEGRDGPLWVVADSQSAGRGRHGRGWSSPRGNLYATLALRGHCDPAIAPELGFAAGLALHRAVGEAANLGHPDLSIKWPNDLLLRGAKIAGLLLEGMHARGEFAVLIGFGVNIASAPTTTPYPASSLCPPSEHLELAAERALAMRQALFMALTRHWIGAEALWRSGFVHLRAAWLDAAHGLGSQIMVRPPNEEVRGVMLGIDDRGRLKVATEAGERRIDAGDLFFGH
ncbi:MAG: biotin--[acetyl-CoA-carboxylase] ligase [Bosea sp.]|nr:biotin--[acetyl-CoA-carboxylase] ligase [Bosea sp. (in: a-proteobacteria)]